MKEIFLLSGHIRHISSTTYCKFSKRATRKEFIEKYQRYANVPKAVLRNILYELTGCEPSDESRTREEIDKHIEVILTTAFDRLPSFKW